MDTYGFLYNDHIDPSNPSQNLITTDDDDNGDHQFRISRKLRSGNTYVLVVTTYSTAITGSFSVTAFGPAWLSLTSAHQSCGGLVTCETDRSASTLSPIQIMGITFSCIILCASIVSILAYRKSFKLVEFHGHTIPAMLLKEKD
ncbi:unnamed protein product [Rotaria sordida]|uniref:Uncharacterized protein n=1 Tax=Rotaria sordida TaxID=392033 RepID=A0A815IGH5_9BILA|nr:unnamed protein product [Rotaria sordida]CAF1608844.1 unnamed protein product [Rotaria sordida]